MAGNTIDSAVGVDGTSDGKLGTPASAGTGASGSIPSGTITGDSARGTGGSDRPSQTTSASTAAIPLALAPLIASHRANSMRCERRRRASTTAARSPGYRAALYSPFIDSSCDRSSLMSSASHQLLQLFSQGSQRLMDGRLDRPGRAPHRPGGLLGAEILKEPQHQRLPLPLRKTRERLSQHRGRLRPRRPLVRRFRAPAGRPLRERQLIIGPLTSPPPHLSDDVERDPERPTLQLALPAEARQ